MRADPTYINSLASALDLASGRVNSLTSELSSGVRINSLSDDPTGAAQSSLLSSTIAQVDSFVQAASTQTSRMQVADSTLGEVVSQLTSAISVSVQATNGTLNSSNVSSMMQQLTGIRDQLLSLANTSYQGQYLFGGSQGSAAPFTLDASTTPATVTYNGDTSVQSISTSTGQMIQTNLPGSTIFGSGSTGVFAALNQMIADLGSGASSSTLSADSSALSTSLNQVTTQRSVLDSSLNRLESASTYAQTQSAQLTAQQSNLIASDPAKIATQLSSTETQYQALLSVVSSVGKNDLFEYL